MGIIHISFDSPLIYRMIMGTSFRQLCSIRIRALFIRGHISRFNADGAEIRKQYQPHPIRSHWLAVSRRVNISRQR